MPWSVIISQENPTLSKSSTMHKATDLTLIIFRGKTSGYLVAYSVITSRKSFPDLLLSAGPTLSFLSRSNLIRKRSPSSKSTPQAFVL